MNRLVPSGPSALSRLVLLSVASALLMSGCDKSSGTGGDAGADATPDTAVPGSLAVGDPCASDDECSGPAAECSDGVYPLRTLSDNPEIQMIGVPFPGGYCSNVPSCTSNADCGTGGECFRPLAPVSAEVLESLGSALPGVDITAFGNYGVCLKPCTSPSDCTRDGYTCATPLGELIGLVEGADLSTFCIAGENPCAACDENATCDASVTPATCTCNQGYEGDGTSCTVVAPVCTPACVHGTCAAGNTCSCDSGFMGEACDQPVVGGCDSNPCQHAGVCTPGTSPSYTCDCAGTGYTGANCDMPVDCGAAPAVTNAGAPSIAGGVGGAATTTSGATATYACNNGYTLSGSAATCQTTGAWTAAPTCQINTCPVLSNPANGTVSGGNTYGDTATFACSNGFILSGASSITCQANMTWNGTPPTCVDNPCLPDPCSGNGTCNTSTGVCTCNPTHTGPSCNMVISTCAMSPCAHGTCTDGPRTCNCTGTGYTGTSCETPVSCGAAPTVTNAGAATVSGGVGGGTSTTYQATAAYTCNSGYAKTGGNPTCGVTGAWGAAPTCTLIMCPAAPTVANAGAATVSGGLGGGTSTSFNATAAYTCNTGFNKTGGNPTCGGSANPGTWGAAPTCTAISCGAAPTVTNAGAPTISGGVGGGSTTTYNATAAYTCNNGFMLSGTNPTCQVGGTWSTAPTCVATAPTHCVVEYRAPMVTANADCTDATTSCQQVSKTGTAAFDNNRRIGLGRLVLRFQRAANGRPLNGGTVQVLNYYNQFSFTSGPSAARVTTVGCTNTGSGISSTCADPFTTNAATALAATGLNTGTLSGDGTSIMWMGCTYTGTQPGTAGYNITEAVTGVGPGCMPWSNHLSNLQNVSNGMGNPPCTGIGCFAVPAQAVNATWVQYFNTFAVGANYGTITMSSQAFVPVEENTTRTRFTIVAQAQAIGTGSTTTCVLP